MKELIDYYEQKSLRYKLIYEFKKHLVFTFIVMFIITISLFLIQNRLNILIRGGVSLCYFSIIILFELKQYVKVLNNLIEEKRDVKEFKNLEKINGKNLDKAYIALWKTIHLYEKNLIKKYLINKKLYKKDKMLFLIQTLKEQRKKDKFLENMETVFILPGAIAIGTTYLTHFTIENFWLFLVYNFFYVLVIVLVLNIITYCATTIREIMRYPVRDRETFMILERNLSDLYLLMK